MRNSSSFLKEVNAFRKSKYVDRMIHIEYSGRRATQNHVHSDGISQFDLRCVRVKLPVERMEFSEDLATATRTRKGMTPKYIHYVGNILIDTVRYNRHRLSQPVRFSTIGFGKKRGLPVADPQPALPADQETCSQIVDTNID